MTADRKMDMHNFELALFMERCIIAHLSGKRHEQLLGWMKDVDFTYLMKVLMEFTDQCSSFKLYIQPGDLIGWEPEDMKDDEEWDFLMKCASNRLLSEMYIEGESRLHPKKKQKSKKTKK